MFLIGRVVAAAGDEAADGIQQFQPVFQGRFCHRLPWVVPFFALKEDPFPPDVLRVNLQFHAVVGDPFPTDFSLGHKYFLILNF
jgi:hypothetical protein